MPTQVNYRRRIARALGPYLQGTATSGSTGLNSVIVATSPFQSSRLSDDSYRDWALLRPDATASADRARVVSSVTMSTGTYNVDNSYANAAYAAGAGEVVELHGVIDPLTLMNDLLNQALKDIFLLVEFTITPANTTNTRHPMPSTGTVPVTTWLLDPKWLVAVGYLSTGEVRAEIDPYARPIRYESYVDGATVYLNTYPRALQTTDTLYLLAQKRAYDHCRASGGAFGDRQGLAEGTDTHEAVPFEEWVVAGVLREFWSREGEAIAERYGPTVLSRTQQWALRFEGYQQAYFDAHLPRQRGQERLSPWGGRAA